MEILELALKRHCESSSSELSAHPSAEDLIALRRGQLGPTDEDLVREHLVHCKSCHEIFLELGGWLKRTAAPAMELSQEHAWRSVQAVLAEKRGRASEGLTRTPLLRVWYQLAAAAAIIAALLAGVAKWNLELYQERHEVIINPQIVELIPADLRVRRSETSEPYLNVPVTDHRWIQLLVHPSEPVSREYHRLTLVSSISRKIWSSKLLPNESGFFIVLLPRTLLQEGRYRLELSTGSETLEVYSFTIVRGKENRN